MSVGRLFTFLLLVVFSLQFSANFYDPVAASQDLDWTNSNGPHISFMSTASFDQANSRPPQPSCTMRPTSVVVRSRSISGRLLNRSEKQIKELCVTDTLYGAVSSNTLQLEGTAIAGTVLLPPGFNGSLLPIPKSNDSFYIQSNTLHIIRNLRSHLQSYKTFSGEYFHSIADSNVIVPVTFPNGRLVKIDYNSRSFSAGSDFLTGSQKGVGIFRYNISLNSMLLFEKPSYPISGPSPRYETAISPNGEFVVRNSARSSVKIFDLTTCNTSLDWQKIKDSCKYTDIYRYLQQQLPNSFTYKNFNFVSNDVVTFRAGIRDCASCTASYKKYALTPYNLLPYDLSNPDYKYLALGDSFASGEGAYKYKTTTDNGDNVCHLSLVSYPYLLANQLNFGANSESVACSGATSKDVVNNNEKYVGQTLTEVALDERPTLEISSASKLLIPGIFSQHKFIEEKKPEITTLSIGGNNVGFADKIMRCLEPDTCYDTYEDRKEILNEINNTSFTLIATYKELLAQSHPKARLYIIGYPKIIKPNGNCAFNVKLNNQEAIFADQLTEYINESIEFAAKRTGVVYVDVEDALVGHRLCETHGSNIAVNGITAGNDRLKFGPFNSSGPIGKESFHPNERGHQLLAKTIRQQTNELTTPMPTPEPTIAPPNHEGRNILNKPKINRELLHVNYDTNTDNNILYKSGTLNTITKKAPALAKGYVVRLMLFSEPTDLGTFTADHDGSITTDILVPATVPSGWHTLHMFYEDLYGEQYDLQKIVYVAESTEDYDGDGVLNDSEICLYGEPAYQDYDQDGIDDACDGTVGEPTAVLVNTPIINTYNSSSDQNSANSTHSATESTNPEPTEQGSEVAPINPAVTSSILTSQTVASHNKKPLQNNNQTKNEQTGDSVLGVSEVIANSPKTVQNIQNTKFSWFWPLASLGGILVTVFAYFSWLKPKLDT